MLFTTTRALPRRLLPNQKRRSVLVLHIDCAYKMAGIRSLSKNNKTELKQSFLLKEKNPQSLYIHALIREPVAVHYTASTDFLYDQVSLATNHT